MYSVFKYYSNNILFVFVFVHNSEPKYYSYSYSAKYLCTNIIRIFIRSFWTNEYYSNSYSSKFWFRILFVFVFGPKNSIRSPLNLFAEFSKHVCRRCCLWKWMWNLVGKWFLFFNVVTWIIFFVGTVNLKHSSQQTKKTKYRICQSLFISRRGPYCKEKQISNQLNYFEIKSSFL